MQENLEHRTCPYVGNLAIITKVVEEQLVTCSANCPYGYKSKRQLETELESQGYICTTKGLIPKDAPSLKDLITKLRRQQA